MAKAKPSAVILPRVAASDEFTLAVDKLQKSQDKLTKPIITGHLDNGRVSQGKASIVIQGIGGQTIRLPEGWEIDPSSVTLGYNKAKGICTHSYEYYEGFTERYNWCTKCGHNEY